MQKISIELSELNYDSYNKYASTIIQGLLNAEISFDKISFIKNTSFHNLQRNAGSTDSPGHTKNAHPIGVCTK